MIGRSDSMSDKPVRCSSIFQPDNAESEEACNIIVIDSESWWYSVPMSRTKLVGLAESTDDIANRAIRVRAMHDEQDALRRRQVTRSLDVRHHRGHLSIFVPGRTASDGQARDLSAVSYRKRRDPRSSPGVGKDCTRS